LQAVATQQQQQHGAEQQNRFFRLKLQLLQLHRWRQQQLQQQLQQQHLATQQQVVFSLI
jgi:hypothetical protein